MDTEWWRKSAGIYAITNTKTGEQYIGQSADVSTRMHNHRVAMVAGDGSKTTPRLVSACKRYGIRAFTFEVIERIPEDADLEWLTVTESDYIMRLKPAYNSARVRPGALALPFLEIPIDAWEHQPEMVTMGDACVQLRLSRKSLDKWLTRFNITPTRHAYDLRYYMLSVEDVERIRHARAQMPSMRRGSLTSGHRRRQQVSSGFANARKTIPKTIPVLHTEPLPDGWLALSTWCAAHGLYGRSVWRAIRQGKLPAPHEGRWQHGVVRNTVLHAYTPEQHEKADALAMLLWPQRFRQGE